MLSAAELAAMRAIQLQALPDTAIIQRYTSVSDGMGGYDQVWAAVGTVAARLYPQSVRSMAETTSGGSQVISETRWFITLPHGTQVTAADRLKIGNRTWEIYQVNNTQSWQTAVRCEVYAFGEEERPVDSEPEPVTYSLDFSDASNSMYLGLF